MITGGATIRATGLLGGALLLVLGGCATRLPPPSGVAAAAPEPVALRPVLPVGIPERLTVPAVDAEGRYRTINSALMPDQTAWHVRSALNVAVLSCRGADEAVLAADYNALLRRQKAVLAQAYVAVQARFRATAATDWQAAQDMHATRVYNFFALPPAKPGFCAAATAILAESRAVDPAAFPLFAAAALPRLEAPFTDVYRIYDRYRRDLAAWEAKQGGAAVQMAAVASPAKPPPAPKLDYVGVETLIDWRPEIVQGRQRIAAR